MMYNTRNNIIRFLGIFFFSFIFLFLFWRYTLSQRGPSIEEINMRDFMSLQKSAFHMEARLKNTKEVRLNGRELFMQDGDMLDEELVFPSGNSILELVLVDTFGKEKKYVYHIFNREREERELPKTLEEARKQKEAEEAEETLTENETKQ